MTIKPLIIDEKEWTYLSTNLAITSRYNSNGEMDASVSARFIPTRINENGEVETLEANAITMFRGSLTELKDSHEIAAMIAIKTALEEMMNSKLGQ